MLFLLSYGGVPEWPKGHAWKACVGKPTVGSNPTLSADKRNVQLQPKERL